MARASSGYHCRHVLGAQFWPDGKHLAVQGDRDIRVITLADKAVKRLTFERERHVSELVA